MNPVAMTLRAGAGGLMGAAHDLSHLSQSGKLIKGLLPSTRAKLADDLLEGANHVRSLNGPMFDRQSAELVRLANETREGTVQTGQAIAAALDGAKILLSRATHLR